MTRKIFFLFAMLLGFVMQVSAAEVAAPDSIFVVKSGRIVSAYEVGTDIDNISFPKTASVDGNGVLVGDESVELKSALIAVQSGYYYVYLSSVEGATSTQEMLQGKVAQIVFSPELMGEELTFSRLDEDFDGSFFQIMYADMPTYYEDDDYEPVMFSSFDWSDYYADGAFCVTSDADGNLVVNVSCEPLADVADFAIQYKGAFAIEQQNANSFTVSGNTMDLRAAFVEEVADGKAFYLTPGNIDKANDLEDCYYYVRLFVPQSNMDGEEIDIRGNREYELTFCDNCTDVEHPYSKFISNGMTGSAFGELSVLDNGDGSYSIRINVEEIDGKYDLQVKYDGTPDLYDLSVPSVYSVAGGDEVDLKSAVLTFDEDNETYTMYLSSKAGVTTLEGMADADIVVTMPEDFVNDDMLHGFSGTETNAKVAIAFGGETYHQANTGNAADPVASGGNARFTFGGGKANIDFTVFGIKQYGGSLKGHYEGDYTRL